MMNVRNEAVGTEKQANYNLLDKQMKNHLQTWFKQTHTCTYAAIYAHLRIRKPVWTCMHIPGKWVDAVVLMPFGIWFFDFSSTIS